MGIGLGLLIIQFQRGLVVFQGFGSFSINDVGYRRVGRTLTFLVIFVPRSLIKIVLLLFLEMFGRSLKNNWVIFQRGLCSCVFQELVFVLFARRVS